MIKKLIKWLLTICGQEEIYFERTLCKRCKFYIPNIKIENGFKAGCAYICCNGDSEKYPKCYKEFEMTEQKSCENCGWYIVKLDKATCNRPENTHYRDCNFIDWKPKEQEPKLDAEISDIVNEYICHACKSQELMVSEFENTIKAFLIRKLAQQRENIAKAINEEITKARYINGNGYIKGIEYAKQIVERCLK